MRTPVGHRHVCGIPSIISTTLQSCAHHVSIVQVRRCTSRTWAWTAIDEERRWYSHARQSKRRLKPVASHQGGACRSRCLQHRHSRDNRTAHDLRTQPAIKVDMHCHLPFASCGQMCSTSRWCCTGQHMSPMCTSSQAHRCCCYNSPHVAKSRTSNADRCWSITRGHVNMFRSAFDLGRQQASDWDAVLSGLAQDPYTLSLALQMVA